MFLVALPKLIIWGAFHITLNSFSVNYLSYDGWSVFQPLFLWVKTQLVVIKRSILQFCAVIEQRCLVASLPYQCWFQLNVSFSKVAAKRSHNLGIGVFVFCFGFFFFLVFCLSIRLCTSKGEVFRQPITTSPDYRTSQSQRNTSCKAQEIVRSRFAFVLCPKFEANHKKPKIWSPKFEANHKKRYC